MTYQEVQEKTTFRKRSALIYQYPERETSQITACSSFYPRSISRRKMTPCQLVQYCSRWRIELSNVSWHRRPPHQHSTWKNYIIHKSIVLIVFILGTRREPQVEAAGLTGLTLEV